MAQQRARPRVREVHAQRRGLARLGRLAAGPLVVRWRARRGHDARRQRACVSPDTKTRQLTAPPSVLCSAYEKILSGKRPAFVDWPSLP